MSDRLTQLQICLDQLVEQFCATLNYVDKNHDFIPTEGEERLVDPQATIAEPKEFQSTMNELSTDLILKTRQILTLITSLPGAGVSPKDQISKINELQNELNKVEQEKIEKIRQKDELLEWCNGLITGFSKDLIDSRRN
ncbi:Mediator of RNA polymerase II transcription subunit 21 [Wickerhamomyces ciferrii]|uniref:Mediator of RNA polymerase II transcription subunit 21 n=1 Tax=Wickerhamomyces ciferrii (strain ATCC 14091 / BCRC 22168 / CBS 111 / JCM 3599 / NBRC 0793 / NRRL Y-1031 F-60-10) TaxID=1206466 RepID=K0KYM8_WICCF|nr:Mediator of RNA polymerase II transcription subunit 21 [Wickerhamomyces ciferrii]CCH46524.1 Mediator of RNA polymerase II transcription subunit 21 [Wickerhamomyces ciferrii]